MWRTAVPPNGRLIAETPALPSNEELAREIADRYTLERELGRGGMAVVFLARNIYRVPVR